MTLPDPAAERVAEALQNHVHELGPTRGVRAMHWDHLPGAARKVLTVAIRACADDDLIEIPEAEADDFDHPLPPDTGDATDA